MSAPESAVAVGGRSRTRDMRAAILAFLLEIAGAAVALLMFAAHASAQTQPQVVPSPGALKKLSLDALQEIEVTSVSKRAENLSSAPSSIQVITADDIRRAGASSLPEALRLASNLHVAQIDSHDWAITARGFNNVTANKLLVLVDGRVVYLPLHAGVYWDMQETILEDIERIEIISGPGATLWGANAVNGVINIITKSAKDTQGILMTGTGGSELQGAFGMRYGAKIGTDLQFRGYGKYSGRDTSALPVGGQQATDDWRMGQGGFRLDWDAFHVNHLTLQSDIYDGRIAQRGPNDIAMSGGNVLGRWSRTFSKDSDLSLQLYYDQTHRNMPGLLVEDLRTWDADFQHRLRLGRAHHVVWGLGYRMTDTDLVNSAVLSVLPPHLLRRWLSAFVQDEVPLGTDRLHLTIGTKLEHNDYTGFEVQPSGRLAWTLSRRQMLWGAVSRAVRTPSQVDRGFHLPLPGTPLFLIAGGPSFVSEELRAYELGYRSEPHERLSVTVAAFNNSYDHIRSLEQLAPPAPLPLVFKNGQNGTSYGAELTAEYRVTDWWRLRSSYTALRLRLRPEPGSKDKTFGSTESHDPSQYGTLRQSFDLPANLYVDVGFRQVGRILNQAVPAYGELDGRLAWQATPSLEWSVVGQNLLHAHHAEFGDLATRREAERAVYGKLVWRY